LALRVPPSSPATSRRGDRVSRTRLTIRPLHYTEKSMKPLLVALGLSVVVLCTSGYAQQPAPKIVTLHKSPVSGQPDKEFLLLSIEWPAGARAPAHTHFGDEYGSVIEGSYSVKQATANGKRTMPVNRGMSRPASCTSPSRSRPARRLTGSSWKRASLLLIPSKSRKTIPS
jgi:hypothetical protein